jgi:thymidylate synthase
LPVWFPEDTGVVHGKRVPCTLGYHFWMRNNQLSIFYPIRSCDWMRHARDDVYLTVRLLLWVLDQVRTIDSSWKAVKPGELSMWIGNLHLFINDWNTMYTRV